MISQMGRKLGDQVTLQNGILHATFTRISLSLITTGFMISVVRVNM